MAGTRLNLLTLNCWGLMLPNTFCALRHERIQAIGDELAKGDYSVVLLQEVWVQSDYDKLCAMLFKVLPHSHYFHSGVFGSGLCVFSKYPMLETLQHRFAVNGYPSKVLHGDWYAAKSAGLVQLLVDDLRVNIYITHLIATYSKDNSPYQAHHTVQAFELSQFIKHTSDGCDMIVVAGDLNNQPFQLAYNLLLANANLIDAWIEQRAAREDDVGATCDHPKNCFTSAALQKKYPTGQRLDYVLFRNNGGCQVVCQRCKVMRYQIPDSQIDFSDHQALSASLVIKKNVTAMAPERKISVVVEMFAAAVLLLEEGERACQRSRVVSAILFVLGLIALVFLSNFDEDLVCRFVLGAIRLILTLAVGGCGWHCVVLAQRERNVFISAKKDMQHMLSINGIF